MCLSHGCCCSSCCVFAPRAPHPRSMQQLSMQQHTVNWSRNGSKPQLAGAHAPRALTALPNSNSRNCPSSQHCPQYTTSSTVCQAQQNGSNGDWRSNLFNRSGTSSSNGSRSISPLSSVLSSVDEAELLQQQAAAFQQAFSQGTLGFGFSAGGLLFPVSTQLLEFV